MREDAVIMLIQCYFGCYNHSKNKKNNMCSRLLVTFKTILLFLGNTVLAKDMTERVHFLVSLEAKCSHMTVCTSGICSDIMRSVYLSTA